MSLGVASRSWYHMLGPQRDLHQDSITSDRSQFAGNDWHLLFNPTFASRPKRLRILNPSSSACIGPPFKPLRVREAFTRPARK